MDDEARSRLARRLRVTGTRGTRQIGALASERSVPLASERSVPLASERSVPLARYRSVPWSSTAMKAFCGMSTEPMLFIRFLPSFCFAQSFFLREMSPP